jgi:hypothetical protein
MSKQGGITIASVELAKAPINEMNKSANFEMIFIKIFTIFF